MSRILKGLPLLPLLGVQAVAHPVLLLLVHLIVPILLSLKVVMSKIFFVSTRESSIKCAK
jgi:hypothetical protein